jgi:hypothetical protein
MGGDDSCMERIFKGMGAGFVVGGTFGLAKCAWHMKPASSGVPQQGKSLDLFPFPPTRPLFRWQGNFMTHFYFTFVPLIRLRLRPLNL